MATFLFWNINRQSVLDIVVSLVKENKVDILMLAESELRINTLVAELNIACGKTFRYFDKRNSNIDLLSCFPKHSIKILCDYRNISIHRFVPPIGCEILLALMHLPGKLYRDDRDQASMCPRYAQIIENCEEKVGHRRTLIVGDLNMNPFEPGTAGAEGFHAVITRNIARKGSRLVEGKSRYFFYNPMWSHFGDHPNEPAGTYFYQNSKPINYFLECV
ncbi:MAG: endonuclease/exonuclease/phosphatase family protein [Candidatus Omnitrophota bacterium]|jgi:hypothetical protein|nr:MAG: endonuclease/exonuclease/phosphatase family protein [Candidatus Omnitrophota bacterium]